MTRRAAIFRGHVRFWPFCPALLVALLLLSRSPCLAQNIPAPPGTAPAAPVPALPPAPPASNSKTVSWKTLLPNIVHDQKPIWLFPVTVARGRHLLPLASFLAVTSGLVALDPHDAPYFRSTRAFNDFDRVLSGTNASIGMSVFPFGFYVASLIRRNSYDQQSVLLAGEAVLDSEIVTTAIKDVDRRLQPSAILPTGNFEDTWFRNNSFAWRGAGSFPSGHMIAAMAIATTFADRYPNPRWHRGLAFGLAGLVGFSRVTTQAHFPSDVFAGAFIGYAITHFVALRRH